MAAHESPKKFVEARITEVRMARSKNPGNFFACEQIVVPTEQDERLETTTRSDTELQLDQTQPSIRIPSVKQTFDDTPWPPDSGTSTEIDYEFYIPENEVGKSNRRRIFFSFLPNLLREGGLQLMRFLNRNAASVSEFIKVPFRHLYHLPAILMRKREQDAISEELRTRVSGWKIGADPHEGYGALQAFARASHIFGKQKRDRAYHTIITEIFDEGRIEMIKTGEFGKQTLEEIYHVLLLSEKHLDQIKDPTLQHEARICTMRARVAFAHLNGAQKSGRVLNARGFVDEATLDASFGSSFGKDRVSLEDVQRYVKRMPFGLTVSHFAQRLFGGGSTKFLERLEQSNEVRREIIESALPDAESLSDIYEGGQMHELPRMRNKDLKFLAKVAMEIKGDDALRTEMIYRVANYRVHQLAHLVTTFRIREGRRGVWDRSKRWDIVRKEVDQIMNLVMETGAQGLGDGGAFYTYIQKNLAVIEHEARARHPLGPVVSVAKKVPGAMRTTGRVLRGVAGEIVGKPALAIARRIPGVRHLVRERRYENGIEMTQYENGGRIRDDY